MIVASTLWAVVSLVAATQDTPALTAGQRAAIERGESVILSRPRPESSWPAVTVYLFIDAAPEEAAAVFTNYELHQTYIPRVKWSRVSRAVDAATKEVDYRVELPIVSDEEYTVRDRISAETAGVYRVDWVLVRAASTKATVGHARFTPYVNAVTGRSGTLMEYHNFVTPGSRLAGLGFIRSRAVRQVEETARAVARRVEQERGERAALADRIAALRRALSTPTPRAP